MIVHCTKCNINWAKLWSNNDDEEEFCPVCNTDFFLEESGDFVGYIKCPFTGKITNAFTGQLLEDETIPVYQKPRIRIKVGKPERETTVQREERELNAILAYQASGDPADYFKTIKKPN